MSSDVLFERGEPAFPEAAVVFDPRRRLRERRGFSDSTWSRPTTERRTRPARSSMRMCLEIEFSEIGKSRGDIGDARVGVRQARQDRAACRIAERIEDAVELRGLIFTHMGEYRRRDGVSVELGCYRSIVMLTGQWSEPSTSAWIFASFTFFLSDSDTRM